MSPDDEPTQLRRTAVAERRVAGPLDRGAMAMGLVVTLAAFAPIAVLSMPVSVGVVLLVGGLLVGGYVAGRTNAVPDGCGMLHGLGTGLAAMTIVVAVTTVTLLADGGAETTPAAVETVPPAAVGGVLGAALVAAAIGGFVGGRSPSA